MFELPVENLHLMKVYLEIVGMVQQNSIILFIVLLHQ